ncbi:S41 family peptidase [Massilia sp. TS11]|uniref:S41 family peptidase n=1 Tax=Massilia sp. TS11 TaxID=2908003 RepID=UPI001EDBC99A|nr:S41 family peptidase [Massilia sp. TS11]MCG2586342.1 S41 family peptidase [Massilia sp. TS11]
MTARTPAPLLLALLLAVGASGSLAQTPAELYKQGSEALKRRAFPEAARLFTQAFAANRHEASSLYNAACAYALAGDSESAFRTLRLAMENGYARADATAADSDFTSLHSDPRWQPLLAEIRATEQKAARLFDSPALATPYAENISEDEKIAGLSKFWSEVKYNFVYSDKLKELDWDKLYLEYLPRVRASKSTAEYYRLLMELCARLQDGHTNVYPPDQVTASQMARTALRARLVEGRVFLTDVLDPQLRAQGVLPGVEVETIDGEPVQAWSTREIMPFQSASTPQDLQWRAYVYYFLAGPAAMTPRVGFRDAGGKRFSLPVPRLSEATLAQLRGAPPAPFEFRMLEGGIAYVALNSFVDARAANAYLAAFDEIAKSKAMVIDVRRNGGGNSNEGYRVLATLAAQPFATSNWWTRNYVPTWRAWKRAMPPLENPGAPWPIDPQHRYSQPVVVLTSPGTYSAAEDFVAAFQTSARGKIVGEATGGSTGQPLFFKLPGGGMARICTKADTFPDGRPWVGLGIQPEVLAPPSVSDAQSGRDGTLEAALRLLR